MTEAFHLGGWGMYPTAIAGLALICSAFGYAAAPDPRRRQLVRTLAFLTFLIACLGFVSGVIKTCTSFDGSVSYSVVIRGVGESLVNIGLGLVTLVMAGIGTAIGVYRSPDTGSDLHGV